MDIKRWDSIEEYIEFLKLNNLDIDPNKGIWIPLNIFNQFK